MANRLSDQWRALIYSDHRPPLAFTSLGVFAQSGIPHHPQPVPASWGTFATAYDLFQLPPRRPYYGAQILNHSEPQSVCTLPQIANQAEPERRQRISWAPYHTQPGRFHPQPKPLDRAQDSRYRERIPLPDKEKRTMAPGYRANNQSRRTNRSYVDHDVFEGLPVRNWRRETITVAPPQIHEGSITKDKWDVELPWGMPKDSHLLPQHSQDLLRAARSGRLYLRRPASEEEEVDPEAALGDKPEKKEEDSKEKGFAVKTWKLVPRHLEGPEIEYLAKRRKGLTGTTLKSAILAGPTMTKASVRRTDAAGNSYVVDLVVAEGQAVEGELISQTVIASSVVSGTAADGTPIQPAPPRRRPPPPKRKAKGPGRGRKRKLPLPPTSVPGEPGAIKTETENEGMGIQEDITGPDGVKVETSTPSNNENDNDDVEMGDDSVVPSDEEGEDGSDDEEGDAQDDLEGDDIEPETAEPELKRTDTDESGEQTNGNGDIHEPERDLSSSPDFPLATTTSTVTHEHGSAGSPLKHVMTYPASYDIHSPNMNSDGEAEAEGDLDDTGHENHHENMHGGLEDNEGRSAYNMQRGMEMEMEMQSHGPMSYGIHEPMSRDNDESHLMEQTGEYNDNEEMLLEGDVLGMDFHSLAQEQYTGQFPDEEEDMSIPLQEHLPSFDSQAQEHGFISLEQQEDRSHQEDLDIHPPENAHNSLGLHGAGGEEDTFEDLLGSLEDHLNDQGPDIGHGLEEESEAAQVEDANDEGAPPAAHHTPDLDPVVSEAVLEVGPQQVDVEHDQPEKEPEPEPEPKKELEPEPKPEPEPEPEHEHEPEPELKPELELELELEQEPKPEPEPEPVAGDPAKEG